MIRKWILVTQFFLLPSITCYALVDYTERTNSSRSSVSNTTQNNPVSSSPNIIQRSAPRNTQRNAFSPSLRFGTQYETIKINTNEMNNESVDFLRVHTQIVTSYDVFFDFRYWISPSEKLEELGHQGREGQFYQGNPRIIMGLNWVDFGSGPTSGNIDLYGGLSMKATDSSAFGHSRNDIIVGVLTSKRFYNFALGIGYEFIKTGGPSKSEELGIGNIQKLYSHLAWRVRPDIRMMLEGATYRINNGDQASRAYSLSETQTFSSLTPSLLLRLSPIIDLRLGATFQTNKVDDVTDMVRARLWDIQGLYGNRLFTGLKFSI